jgi:Sulfotransferase family
MSAQPLHDRSLKDRIMGERVKLVRRRVRARAMLLRDARAIRSLRYYGMFIGYPRTGHTLLASLLDAHPRMAFANGLDAARYFIAGFSVPETAMLSVWNSRHFTLRGRRSTGYNYVVPGGWHGRWDRLEVVGDKSGDLFSARLVQDPDAMPRVLEMLGEKARFVSVLRNPYDTITTMAARARGSLRDAADEFLALCEANARARRQVPAAAWLDVHHEALVARPHDTLRTVVEFFDQSADQAYLDACSRLIFPQPRRTRDAGDWTGAMKDYVSGNLQRYPWFSGYAF